MLAFLGPPRVRVANRRMCPDQSPAPQAPRTLGRRPKTPHSGHGIAENWHMVIHWSYRASGTFAGESVNFILELPSPDDGGADDILVNELDTHGAGTSS